MSMKIELSLEDLNFFHPEHTAKEVAGHYALLAEVLLNEGEYTLHHVCGLIANKMTEALDAE